jgi:hypothetical protein
MGLFLALSGVMIADSGEVRAALADFAAGRSGGCEPVKGTTETPNVGIIAQQGQNVTVLYPDGFCEWDDASRHVSRSLNKPVFSFHIHDGDLWMFLLFQNGEEIGFFNPLPEYWAELAPEEKAKWKGDAGLIARILPAVSEQSVSRYFVTWDPGQTEQIKAYSSDRFSIGDCWQMCDFMEKLGLSYPLGDDATILGSTFRLWTRQFRLRQPPPQEPRPETKPKPWWRFWGT